MDFDLREGIFDEQDGARVVDHFFRVLDAFLFDSGQAVRRLSLTSPQETQRLARNGIRLRLSRQCSPVFVACLKNKPGNNRMPWPSFKQTSVLTYGDMNRRANAVAQLLRERELGSETPIGIYLSRSPEMIIAMLGF